MALVTLCPGCGTTFRVNAVQLQAHNGDVRCGHCLHVFNGFATLLTVSESVIEYPIALQSQPITISEPVTASMPAMPAESFAVTPDTHVAMDLPVSMDSNRTAIAISDDFLSAAEPRKQSHGRWAAASACLLLLLIGQIAYINRTELTIVVPDARPYLERYCAAMSCTVPYPQDVKQLGIEASDLQENTLRQPEIAMLSAVIRNHASFPQALPALQLSLLDEHDQVIVSRIFTAQEYLPTDNKSLQFIASQHDIEIRLNFDSSHLDASGYRLLLLYL